MANISIKSKAEHVLVLFKPDVQAKELMGHLLTRLAQTRLELVAMKLVSVSEELAKEHYHHLKDQSFFREIVDYLQGKLHSRQRVAAFVYAGENAIARCREIAGATNPEEAHPSSIRGSLGRITTQGVYENVVHVSSDKKEAEREIKLWFSPQEIGADIFVTQIKTSKNHQQKVWA